MERTGTPSQITLTAATVIEQVTVEERDEVSWVVKSVG